MLIYKKNVNISICILGCRQQRIYSSGDGGLLKSSADHIEIQLRITRGVSRVEFYDRDNSGKYSVAVLGRYSYDFTNVNSSCSQSQSTTTISFPYVLAKAIKIGISGRTTPMLNSTLTNLEVYGCPLLSTKVPTKNTVQWKIDKSPIKLRTYPYLDYTDEI